MGLFFVFATQTWSLGFFPENPGNHFAENLNNNNNNSFKKKKKKSLLGFV